MELLEKIRRMIKSSPGLSTVKLISVLKTLCPDMPIAHININKIDSYVRRRIK
jgi:hypothetical protein